MSGGRAGPDRGRSEDHPPRSSWSIFTLRGCGMPPSSPIRSLGRNSRRDAAARPTPRRRGSRPRIRPGAKPACRDGPAPHAPRYAAPKRGDVRDSQQRRGHARGLGRALDDHRDALAPRGRATRLHPTRDRLLDGEEADDGEPDHRPRGEERDVAGARPAAVVGDERGAAPDRQREAVRDPRRLDDRAEGAAVVHSASAGSASAAAAVSAAAARSRRRPPGTLRASRPTGPSDSWSSSTLTASDSTATTMRSRRAVM